MMKEGAARDVRLDPLVEGYLDYQRDVRRRTHRTVIDNRCTLRRVTEVLASQGHGRSLAQARLEDFLGWLEAERRPRAARRQEKTEVEVFDGDGYRRRCACGTRRGGSTAPDTRGADAP